MDFRSLFTGHWSLERVFYGDLFPSGDTLPPLQNTTRLDLVGEAVFTPSSCAPNLLHAPGVVEKDPSKPESRLYHERGRYWLQGTEVTFTQDYLYFFEDSDACRVLFPNGRFFYKLTHQPTVLFHLCGADRYDGFFKAHSHSHWELSWTVTGPRKAYSLMTHYKRT